MPSIASRPIKELTPFTKKVIAVIRKIPKGKVATYGQIAKLAGSPHASRAVVWILHSSSKKQKLPWHRVVNGKGKIAFDSSSFSHKIQCSRLEREGVEVDLASSKVDLKRYQYKAKIGR